MQPANRPSHTPDGSGPAVQPVPDVLPQPDDSQGLATGIPNVGDLAEQASALEPDQDRLMVEAAQQGDRAAFGVIVARHQRLVFGYLRSRLTAAADAEDLCQEVFLRCYRGQARFADGVQLRPWLIGIARNVLHEHVRRVKRRKEVAWTELCLQLEDMIDELADRHEAALAHLPACLESLGQSARQALDMRYQTQMRLAEIGQQLRRSEGAVKLLMFRARQALKNCLDSKLLDGNLNDGPP
jgi:RNA polymerase sigma-70 factor (ECF subfamily)